MPSVIEVGRAAKSFEQSPEKEKISKVILWVDGENYVESGDDTGATFEADCFFATQDMADSLLNRLKNITYKPYSASNAIFDQSAELGDTLSISDNRVGLYRQIIRFGALMTSDIKAPGGSDLEHEYKYKPKSDRETQREFANRITNAQAQSLIEQSIDGISLSVSGDDGTTTFELKSGTATLDTETVDLHVKSVNVDGTFTANKIKGGTLEVGGVSNQSGYISVLNEDGNWAGTIDNSNLSLIDSSREYTTKVGPKEILLGQVTGYREKPPFISVSVLGNIGCYENTDGVKYGSIWLRSSDSLTGINLRGDNGEIYCQKMSFPDGSMVDYIVERGTYGIWTYEKWSSGKAVCWGKESFTDSINQAFGSLYMGNSHQTNFPSGLFIEEPQLCQITPQGTTNAESAMLTIVGGLSSTKTQRFRFVRPDNSVSGTFTAHYYAVGTWK